ncbi:acyl-CoA dehydrogenase [Actinophytocola xinjiangensis]|uniref:Acyl-CoA dehydrogenase n=2 Tax=Actinophytocola xinjiangensis TaxID=485602 RepID=A0A7Z1AW21_9PSEU|nr:acyl-CoA dehydrogenase [Actinophytocola xinjiangensis]
MRRRASELVPVLRANAAWTEQNRQLHPESIEAAADAGIFRMRVPKRYGGYECDAQTLVDVSIELGRGDGSTAWVFSVYWIPGWMVGMFPDEVQDEVFTSPDVRVCGTLSPSGMAAPADGGIVVNGKWGFISGALHAQWQEIIAILVPEQGEPYPVMALVPISELEIVDDWHVGGLRGSGSVTTVAKDVFIPQARVLPLPSVMTEQYASVLNAESPAFRVPLLGAANSASVGGPVGLAKAALELFYERMNRKLTYTNYESQAEAPITHLRVADAAVKIDQAEFHARRVAELADRKGLTGEPWTLEERIRSRADIGTICKLTKSAVETLAMSSGGSSLYDTSPMQRILRDIQAINLHALMAPDANHELYGRMICGLEPNTTYV